MNIPIFLNVKYVENSGYLTPDMQIYEDTLNQTLRNGLSNNGWTVPQITSADLAIIAPEMPDGTLWYDTDLNVFVGKQNGVLVKFTTTAYP